MSINYRFYPRNIIGKHVKDIHIQGGYEEHRISQANIFCSLFGLPQIPYYYCFESSKPVVKKIKNHKHWNLSFKLDFEHSRYDIHTYIEQSYRNKLDVNIVSKEYKSYNHWQEWGLVKLEKITVEDVLNNPNIKRKDIYANFYFLEEIKRDIKRFLWYYKNHYYRISLV